MVKNIKDCLDGAKQSYCIINHLSFGALQANKHSRRANKKRTRLETYLLKNAYDRAIFPSYVF